MVRKPRSRTVSGIPLHLLPHVVARQVMDWGDAVHRISIRRTHWHQFNVTVRTKPVPRELATRVSATVSFPHFMDTTGTPAAAARHRGSPT